MKKANLLATLGASVALLTASSAMAAQNLIDTAKSAGQFNTLIAAVKAADLEGEFAASNPKTVFAPTDAAFAKLGDEKIAELLKPENKATLRKILLYHVLPGSIMSSELPASTKVKTLAGLELQVTSANGVVVGTDGDVIQADVSASNGVIHAIDDVLALPAAKPVKK